MPFVERGPVPLSCHWSKTSRDFISSAGKRPPGHNGGCVDRWGGLTLLNLRDTTHEIIEALYVGLGTVHREGEVMVLEVETYAGKVDLRLYACSPKLRGVT